MACEGLITTDILNDCDNPTVGGLETNVVLINEDDIDITATTYDPVNPLIITNLQLLSGKTGYLLQGVKQVNSDSYEVVKKEFGVDKWKHIFSGVILNPSAANKNQLYNMSQGSKFVVVVERKWKGEDNEEAFEVLGIKSGLELITATYNSKENDGAIPFTLESTEGFEEPKPACTLLETDYTTTKAAHVAKFAEA
jgi:hypothetical protein